MPIAKLIAPVVLSFLLLMPLSSQAENSDYVIDTLNDNLEFPWSLALLPDGGFLLSQRNGVLRRLDADGAAGQPIGNVPSTYVASQGGFFDVILDQNFAGDQTIYLAYADGNSEANGTAVTRATLGDNELVSAEQIMRVAPDKDTPAHYGGKLLQLPDGSLMLTTGDGFEYREAAQDRFSQLGKILRFNRDGTVPDDNPFADGVKGNPYVYTFGHRSPQGLARDPATGDIYMHEHGPRGGDEVNRVVPGTNYGWPAATHGVNYSGARVSPFTSLQGMEDPLQVWVPSIAPSGLAVYRGAAFPQWDGSLLVGALVNMELRRVTIGADDAAQDQPLFSEIGERVREVRVGPEGYIYILTDGPAGKLLRIRPAP